MLSTTYPRQLDDQNAGEESTFSSPPLMAISSAAKHAEEFKDYAWNLQSRTDPKTGKNETEFTFEYVHTYIERCYLL